ncbi:unnamed protein product, partial [Ixodes hexagonus]
TEPSIRRRLKRFGAVEPFFFLVTFTLFARRVVSSDLMLAKACTLLLNHTRNECSSIEDRDLRVQALQVGNNYNLAAILVITAPALFTGMLLGSFSDVYGRKWPMLLAPIGVLVSVAGYAISVVYWRVPIIWLVLVHIPSGLLGGTLMVTSGVYSHVSEVADAKDRAFRFSVLEVVNILGMTLGTTLGGVLFRYGGYLPVYALCSVTLMTSIVWLLVFMPDHVPLRKTGPAGVWTSLLSFFSMANFRDALRMFSRKRRNERLQLMLLVFSGCLIKVAIVGDCSGDIPMYYLTGLGLWRRHGASVHVWFLAGASRPRRRLVVTETCPACRRGTTDSLTCRVGDYSVLDEPTLYKHIHFIYFSALAMGTLSGISSVAVKNQISQLVLKEELSMIFMVMSITESVCSIGAATAFSQLYNAFLTSLPGAPYFAAACLLLFPAVTLS